jgi:hypothetical protein
MEGNEFVIEKLYKGSALNYRAFFMEDQMYVHVRCAKNTKLLAFEQKSIELILMTHPDFEKKLLSY